LDDPEDNGGGWAFWTLMELPAAAATEKEISKETFLTRASA